MSQTRLEKIQAQLQAEFSPLSLEVIDDSAQHVGHAGAKDGAGHFTVKIASDVFNDKSLVQRHQMVYRALNDMIGPEIHALSIEARGTQD